MGSLIGHKPYAPVRCFWVEPTGKWIARVLLEGEGQKWQTVGRFETEAEAEACTRKAWDTMDLFSSSTSKAYVLPSGEEVTSGELPPGAMFDAWWLHDDISMEDGITLMVVLPNGVHWSPDSRAGNCGSKDDNEHCCWLRRGDPRTGMIHVDKGHPEKGELSCTAGAGSIASLPQEDPHHYHGHLHHGWLTAG
jgi:hypothetical protein